MNHLILFLSCCVIILLCCCHAKADVASSEIVLGSQSQDLKVGPGMDASNRNLSGCKFIGLDLSKANFNGANLKGCYIFQCNFKGASFRKTNFDGLWWNECDIQGADFTDAILNGTIRPLQAHEVDFSSEQLMSTQSYKDRDFTDCTIRFVRGTPAPSLDFRNAKFQNSLFSQCDLRKCDFTDANITGASFHHSKMTAKQIVSTYNYKHQHLIGIRFGHVDGKLDLSDFDLTKSRFFSNQSSFSNAILTDCEFYGLPSEQLKSTKSYQNGQLIGVAFRGQDFSKIDMSGQNLSNASFHGCIFNETSFNDAVISNCWFDRYPRGEIDLTIEQIKSTWNYKNNRMVGIKFPEELAKALEQEQLKRQE